jgi:hypothetical protein
LQEEELKNLAEAQAKREEQLRQDKVNKQKKMDS